MTKTAMSVLNFDTCRLIDSTIVVIHICVVCIHLIPCFVKTIAFPDLTWHPCSMDRALFVLVLSVCYGGFMVRAAPELPSESSCTAKYYKIGEQAILSRLTPCQGGITPECCAAGQALAGASGELAYCLCSPNLLGQIIGTIEGNALARAAGITGTSIKSG